ncbi:hypothetical protein [Pseudobacteriovorax antillogorgiicola]|uniref:Uncharacterized protein n=1 Tax=Pseudobacteriovorax antillogorgiicola TaxID=1513793 RepID=A0A1Y6BFI3_9BACT|nr:hypothetical protein [Pseudobacteriovorax antillogorgiicola]TCS56210.1 hypothetical protein EDD56_10432 [Pseudobacteriovorax antillogorgiicola]SMF08516.1 hypothetical protein SAMN06296036_104302 [Pseudobacteriovorax antillogorgiicola]
MYNYTMLGIIIGLQMSCGAPTRTASSVGEMLAEPRTLNEKVKSLCLALEARGDDLSQSISDSRCDDSGLYATDYQSGQTVRFKGSDPIVQEETMQLASRGQVWLGTSLIGFFGRILKDLNNNSVESVSGIQAGDSLDFGETQSLNNLVEVNISFLSIPEVDFDDLLIDFELAIDIKGIIDVDMDIKITVGIFDRRIVAIVNTTRSSEESAFKDLDLSFFLVPHAGDIYVDVYAGIEMINIGLTAVLQEQLDQILSLGLEFVFDQVFIEPAEDSTLSLELSQ